MTPAQVAERARAIADETVAWDMADWTGWSDIDQRAALMAALWMIRERRYVERAPSRRCALRLFRSWLSPAHLDEMRRRGYVHVTGSAGGRYRIYPRIGRTERIERHGSREYGSARFCLHPDERLPQADISLGHYLLLLTDEPAFLEAANETPTVMMLWNGDWRRRLNRARRERAAA